MGSYEREQPMLAKESIRPSLMITTPTPATTASPFAENTAQPHPYPAVQPGERRLVAVFEIFKPTLGIGLQMQLVHHQIAMFR